MPDGSLIARFGRARRDARLAVLEGLHPLKHALRFHAEVLEAVTPDAAGLARLAAELAPDLLETLPRLVREIDRDVFAQLSPLAPSTGVMALAQRPAVDVRALLDEPRDAPLVLLEDPRDLGNLGACVRVAAAADAAGVLTGGSHDPWHPDALRGAAGLHFALPVVRLERPQALLEPTGHTGGGDARGGRPLLALDPAGEPLDPASLPPRALLAFGTERHGLSDGLLEAAERRVSIPMRAGVSSLNLATSVAAVLFARRFAERAGGH
ncbi:MAG TPA: TrmH family RNA methyltransferase [Solirubrobacteraceae bacterium]|nr:TrmH family RNA methyltransferase [Solirubrobacteraceae bacterium]